MKKWSSSLSGLTNRVIPVCLIWLVCAGAQGAFVPEAGRLEQIASWLPETPQGPGRPIGDRGAWEALAAQPQWQRVVQAAERKLKTPMPLLTDELYLDYSKTGNRDRYQAVYFNLRNRYKDLVLAECLEDRGRFVRGIEECIEQLCGLKSWGYPAHDGALRDFKGQEEIIDLGAAHWAWDLASGDYVLGEKLSPAVRQRLHENMRRRVFAPIRKQVEGELAMHWWFSTTNNWNSVCLANVTGAALAMLEDAEERAFYVATAEHYVQNFLKGFAADGYCSEGVGYWNYGYGSFLLLAETLWQATDGKIDLLGLDGALPPAQYGSEIRITERVSPAFADCSVDAQPSTFWLTWLSRRLDRPLIEKEADLAGPKGMLHESLLFAFDSSVSDLPAQTDGYTDLPARTWFDKAGVLIVRPGKAGDCRLAAALKGGHNNEHHNHNDVGSYIVVVDGAIGLADPGSEVYTKRTFGGRRYDSKVLNSWGHPVPVVAGKLQRTSREAQGKVIETTFTEDEDRLELDIASAYEVPSLEKLERTFVYSRREAGSLTVTDIVRFSEPQTFETAMITFEPIKQIDASTLEIGKARVKIECAQPFDVVTEAIDEDVRYKKKPTRIGIALKEPVESAEVVLRIVPL